MLRVSISTSSSFAPEIANHPSIPGSQAHDPCLVLLIPSPLPANVPGKVFAFSIYEIMQIANRNQGKMEAREPEAELLQLQALLCQALSDPKRLRILYRISEREVSVGEIAQDLNMSIANASQHLGLLRARGLVRARKEGNSVLYSLAYPEIMQACKVLRLVLARQLADRNRLSGLLETLGAAGE